MQLKVNGPKIKQSAFEGCKCNVEVVADGIDIDSSCNVSVCLQNPEHLTRLVFCLDGFPSNTANKLTKTLQDRLPRVQFRTKENGDLELSFKGDRRE